MNQELEILQNKVDSMLSKKRDGNDSVLRKIEQDNTLLEDFVLDLGRTSPIDFYANGNLRMQFDGLEFTLHNNALRQIGDKFGIPQKYLMYLDSTEWGRQLAQRVLTDHKENIDRNRVLIRTVGNEARAVLSDKYRRLNSDDIYQSFILGSQQNGAEIYDAFYSETKTYMSSIIPRVFKIETENNGSVYSVFGARISNSDYGNGSLSINAFQMNVACLNGMVSQSMLRQVHLGKRLPDNVKFSQKTYELDTSAMASAVDDIMKTVLSEDRILKTADAIKAASVDIIDPKKEILKLPKMGLTKEEVGIVEQKLLENNPDDGVIGRPTKWKLSQALTAASNQIGDERKRELDEIAGKLISL